MSRSSFQLLIVAVVLSVSAAAYADRSPQAVEVLTKANAVTQKLTAVSYEGEYLVEGDLAGKLPVVSGKVLAQRGESGKRDRLRIEGALQMPGQPQPAAFRYATDGDQAFKVDEANKLYVSGRLADARVPELEALFPPKYFGDAFGRELNAESSVHEGLQTVEGVECDVVKVTFDAAGNRSIRYFLGKKDGLLRRAENMIRMMMPGATSPSSSRIIFNVKGLDPQPKSTPENFRLPCPEGFRSEVFQGNISNAQQNAAGFIASGAMAPDWELKTTDGKTISLKSLRGKVVVLDFWASWCGPCKMAMPGLQKVHEQFRDKPVAILGVNCRERSKQGQAQGLEFVRQKGLTYTQLLDGDSVALAYKVQGIPCFYIIGPDGKVIFATAGFNPQLHEFMSDIITKNLPAQPPAASAPAAKNPAAP